MPRGEPGKDRRRSHRHMNRVAGRVAVAHSHRMIQDAAHDTPTAVDVRASHRIADRVRRLDWQAIAMALDADGFAVAPTLLTPSECSSLAESYTEDDRFRSRVVMARHGFGRGEYKYFDYPLPDLVGALRASFYPHLSGIANRWSATLGFETRYPDDHAAYLDRCHRAGQTKPTPLILRYAEGDHNCLHQDLYGENVFPLQAAFLLSTPDEDFTGGEFVLTEQRPLMQSRVVVVPLGIGDGVIFPVRHRPVQGTRGSYRVTMRHGVSQVRSGLRYTLGIIFHDAE